MVHMPNAVAPRAKEVYANLRNGEPDLGARQQSNDFGRGLTRKDLEEILGTRTRVSEVLNRKRGLSINMIRALHDKLGISAEILIRSIRGPKTI
jgi:hypothetical protein